MFGTSALICRLVPSVVDLGGAVPGGPPFNSLLSNLFPAPKGKEAESAVVSQDNRS